MGLIELIDRKARDERAKYGWQGSAGSVFAVKVLRASVADSVSIRDFRREALLLGRVDHPGIIKMHHFGKLPQPFMVEDSEQSLFFHSTHVPAFLARIAKCVVLLIPGIK